MSFSCEKIRKARKEHKCEYGAIIQKGRKKMITYTPPKVDILTNRSWGSTPESNIKSIIQALEVCRDNTIKPEKYESVIKKYCINGNPPHARLLEFSNFEVENNDITDEDENGNSLWYDIDICTLINLIDFHNERADCEDQINFTCSIRNIGYSNKKIFTLFKHANLPMTHDAKRIMIRIECASKVGHHLRTHRSISWCAQASSSLPLTEGFTLCHSKPEWFERNKEMFDDIHYIFGIQFRHEEQNNIPKKERIANQCLPNDWIMRPRVGVASRRQWLEMCAQRISDGGTHPETKYVCQMIQDKLLAMGEDG